MNLSWHNTDQVWVSSRLTYFYRSYCPLLTFSFPDFSLQSYKILNSNSVYELLFTSYRLNSSFVALDVLLHELLPFANINSFLDFSNTFKMCVFIVLQDKTDYMHFSVYFTLGPGSNDNLCVAFYELLAWVGCWSSVYIRRIIYNFF